MKRVLLSAAAALAGFAFLLPSGPSHAAKGWGIEHEVETAIEAKVVDVLCELTGDCPDNCGGGKRQLGLLQDDGTLHLVVKTQTLFAGGVADLLPVCGKRIVADGLHIQDPVMHMFFVQSMKLVGEEELKPTWQFIRDWRAANGYAPGAKVEPPWFRQDKRIVEILEESGVFGIPGLEPEE